MIIVISSMSLLEQPLYDYTLALWAYAFSLLSIVMGLCMHGRAFWQLRVSLAGINASLIGVSLGLILVSSIPKLAVVAFCIVQVYRLFSLLRVIKNRVNSEELRNKSLRSELVLSIVLLVLIIVEQSSIAENLSLDAFWLIIAAIQFIVALIFLQHVFAMRVKTAVKIPEKFNPDNSLPSLTVAIPARNETSELNDCLSSLLASDYPKLEVLVIDDCSQDNTPSIIKQFAHQGVRFIAGKTPPDSWLAKNYAYHQLLDEAGGKLVLFCGTDARFQPNSLRLLVQVMLESNCSMVSVLPVRTTKLTVDFLLQPMRYWRELVIPRIFDNTPPVLSTCWLVNRSYINDLGGFGAYKKTIRPERIISRSANTKSSYTFIRSTSRLGIASVKSLRAQWGTAIRTRYPELKNRPENTFFYSILYGMLLIGSPVLFIYGLYSLNILLILATGLTVIILLFTHLLVDTMATGKVRLLVLVTLPISAVLELVASNYSMWAYEFSDVIWKGRNVCLPVLQAIPSLPPVGEANLDITVIRDKDRKH